VVEVSVVEVSVVIEAAVVVEVSVVIEARVVVEVSAVIEGGGRSLSSD
jgi:UDP-3-O-[3-hydroxymyristoyl] glucosamine N-acyltransferase